MVSTLRGEGSTSKRDNSLIVTDGGDFLFDELGLPLLDESANQLTE